MLHIRVANYMAFIHERGTTGRDKTIGRELYSTGSVEASVAMDRGGQSSRQSGRCRHKGDREGGGIKGDYHKDYSN